MSDFIVAKTKQGFLNKLNAGEIPDKAVVFIEDFDEIYTHGKFYGSKYYDDGSGEVVPVKHPDLSTQPSILPYKFAGNYVYEQMVWVDGGRFTDDVGEIDLIRFEDYKQNGENNIILDRHFFIVDDNYYGNYTPLGNDWFHLQITSDDKRIFLRRCGSTMPVCKGVWVRVIWTAEPNVGGYYNAPESKYNFYIKGYEGLSLILDEEDLLRGSTDAVKLSDDLVERFISGTDIYVDTGGESVVMVECAETSESEDKTNSGTFAITYRHDTYSRILSIKYALPIAAELLNNGEKITLVITKA